MKIPDSSNSQNVSIFNREQICISGVLDVQSFDETLVEAETELGCLRIKGDGLKIEKLSLEEHELSLTGYIFSCEYANPEKVSRNIFARMFK